jgi:hypothetical protein
MMQPDSALWHYLSSDQRQLAIDGQLLIADREQYPSEHLSDYSYLVFPFAKLYEGFLKQLFLDIGAIPERDYRSDHFRIGKALSPNLARLLGQRSAYAWIARRYSPALATELWTTWKEGRNLIFHYFPHNIRRLTLEEAHRTISTIVETMERAVHITHVRAGIR